MAGAWSSCDLGTAGPTSSSSSSRSEGPLGGGLPLPCREAAVQRSPTPSSRRGLHRLLSFWIVILHSPSLCRHVPPQSVAGFSGWRQPDRPYAPGNASAAATCSTCCSPSSGRRSGARRADWAQAVAAMEIRSDGHSSQRRPWCLVCAMSHIAAPAAPNRERPAASSARRCAREFPPLNSSPIRIHRPFEFIVWPVDGMVSVTCRRARMQL